jgi:hypothetical protein
MDTLLSNVLRQSVDAVRGWKSINRDMQAGKSVDPARYNRSVYNTLSPLFMLTGMPSGYLQYAQAIAAQGIRLNDTLSKDTLIEGDMSPADLDKQINDALNQFSKMQAELETPAEE